MDRHGRDRGRQAPIPGQPPEGGKAVSSAVVHAAAPDRDLGDYDAIYENTNQPCDYLSGPGTPDDAAEFAPAASSARRPGRDP